MEVTVPAMAEALPVPPSREELRQELGKPGGAEEMVAQMRAARPQGAQAVVPPPDLASVPRRPAKSPRRMTPHERAAVHLGFKKFAWPPAMALGLVCILFGALCLLSLGGIYIWPLKAIPRPEGAFDNPQIVKNSAGGAWAIPHGAKYSEHDNGMIWYEDESGFEQRAEPAGPLVEFQDQDRIRRQGFLKFGIGLSAVGVILAAFALWMWSDVRLVRRAEAPPEEQLPKSLSE